MFYPNPFEMQKSQLIFYLVLTPVLFWIGFMMTFRTKQTNRFIWRINAKFLLLGKTGIGKKILSQILIDQQDRLSIVETKGGGVVFMLAAICFVYSIIFAVS